MTSALPKLTLYDFPSHDTQVAGWSSLSPFVLQVDSALRQSEQITRRARLNAYLDRVRRLGRFV